MREFSEHFFFDLRVKTVIKREIYVMDREFVIFFVILVIIAQKKPENIRAFQLILDLPEIHEFGRYSFNRVFNERSHRMLKMLVQQRVFKIFEFF